MRTIEQWCDVFDFAGAQKRAPRPLIATLIADVQRDALESAARHIESVGEAAGQLQDRGAEHPEVEAIKAVAYAGARGIRALAPEPKEKP